MGSMAGQIAQDELGRFKPNRDPVSVFLDDFAGRLLARCYAADGDRVTMRLPNPGPTTRRRFSMQGIDVTGPDNPSVPGKSGGQNARTRYARGVVRALYYQHKRSARRKPLRFEVGRLLAASPQYDPDNPRAGGIPPGRNITIWLDKGGRKAQAAVTRLPDRDRIWTDDAKPAARFSQAALRDWS
jgi:hypothetical protein